MVAQADVKTERAAFTPGPWRVGADLCRVHPAWRDEAGGMAKASCHRNGYAKTIATVANENHDWRDIGAQVADAVLIAAAPEMYALLDRLNRKGGLGLDVHEAIEAMLAKARGQ